MCTLTKNRLSCLVALATIGCVAACSKRDDRMLRVQYVSIGVETLTAVTSENIEERGRPCVISAAGVVADIKAILDSAARALRPEEAFTDLAVRAKIFETVNQGEQVVAIVENDGPMRRGTVDFVLSRDALNTLRRLIEGACKPRS